MICVNNLKIAICDDDDYMHEKVTCLLKIYFTKRHRGVDYFYFQDGMYLLESDETFDIILLDIEMKVVDGIEVKERICRQRSNSKIIFLTSHREMAIESVGRNVYGFVPKDEMNRLERYLNTIMHELDSHSLIMVTGEMIDIFDIAYIHAASNYCYIYDGEGNEKVYRILLNQLEIQLENYKQFTRIHKSYIVNFDYVQKCSYGSVVLKKEKRGGILVLPVSRKYTSQVSEKYILYKKERCRYG